MIDLKPVIESYITDYKTNTFTSLPAIVKSYDNITQTIVATPVMTEPFEDGDIQHFPSISDVPVVFPAAGGGSLTFPIKKGDEVLLTFSSRNFDTWWETSKIGELSTSKRFNSINDAVAHIGIKSKGNSLKASTEDVELLYNDNVIKLKDNGDVEVETKSKFSVTNQQEELIAVLSDSLQILADSTVKTVYGISPLNNKAEILSVKNRLDTFKR